MNYRIGGKIQLKRQNFVIVGGIINRGKERKHFVVETALSISTTKHEMSYLYMPHQSIESRPGNSNHRRPW